MAAVIALLIAVAIGLAYDKRVAAIFVAVVDRGVRAVARHRRRIDGAGAARCRGRAITMLAAGDRQYPPARRADAVGGDVARPRSGACWSPSSRSTAICGGNSWRRCRTGRRRSISSTSRPARPTASARSCKQTAPQATVEDVPMLRGRIVAARGVKAEDLKPSSDTEWVLQSDRGITYTRRNPQGLAGGRGRMVAGRL